MTRVGDTTEELDVIVLVLGAAIAVFAIVLFNRLVKARQLVEEGWSGIDVQLKRRADLVPNLVEAVKGYAGHERALFDEIARLRAQVGRVADRDVAGRGQLEGALLEMFVENDITGAVPD